VVECVLVMLSYTAGRGLSCSLWASENWFGVNFLVVAMVGSVWLLGHLC
jgi:hypothetical protein